MNILDRIDSAEDVKAIDKEKLPALCGEIRRFLVENVSETGGHLASNLGAVELTVALHRVFDLASDRLVFDVGHQSYVHKMLTGRKARFGGLRKLGGISGFPRPSESGQDAFIGGHASNSISVALGMARARTLKNEDYNVLALIGDGALTGGLAYEALSDAGQSEEPLIVILNDNGMSITDNVGGMAKHLAGLRSKSGYYTLKKLYRRFMGKIPGGKAFYRFTHKFKTTVKNAIFHCSMFEEMGFHYLGPVDGHNMDMLLSVLSWAKRLREPVLVHVSTVKGKGYAYSETRPDQYHGVDRFDPEIGIDFSGKRCFSEEFGNTVTTLAKEDPRVCAITAAMQGGCGLNRFAKEFPGRFFDVGIAEGHAAAMAGGMAKQGLIPVFAVYSTFLQRSFDMLIHDIALQNLHVVLAVDRAGTVGEDGETHQGMFDVAYLSQIPNMTVLCPASFSELRTMLRQAVLHMDGPVAVRYPRGGEGHYTGNAGETAASVIRTGEHITIVSYGLMINNCIEAAGLLEKMGISAEVVKLSGIKPMDTMSLVAASVNKTGKIAVVEDTASEGCAGQRILAALAEERVAVKSAALCNLGDQFLPQGRVPELYRLRGIDAAGIARRAAEL